MGLRDVKTKPEGQKPKVADPKRNLPKAAMKKAVLAVAEPAERRMKTAVSEFGQEKEADTQQPADQMQDLTEAAVDSSAHTVYVGGKKLVRTIRQGKQEPNVASPEPAEEEDAAPESRIPDLPDARRPKEATDPLNPRQEAPQAPRRAKDQPQGKVPSSHNRGETERKSTALSQENQRVRQRPQKGDKRDFVRPADVLRQNEEAGVLKGSRLRERQTVPPKRMAGGRPKEIGGAAQRIKTTAQAAAKTQAAKKSTVQAAARAREFARRTIERTTKSAEKTAKAVGSAIKGFLAAMKTLVASLTAGGSLALVVILLICLIAFVAGSAFGIFFAAEPTGYGTPIKEVASALNEEFYAELQKTIDDVEHDVLEFDASDGVTAIRWEDVFAVFSASVTGGADGAEAVTMDEAKTATLRRIMWDMNEVSHTTRTISKEVEVPVENEDGEVELEKQIITETILTIHIQHKTPAEMAAVYGFNARQNEAVALLAEPQYASLWAKLLGGFTNGTGEIITPDTDWTGTSIFTWPLPQNFSITSRFGYRSDPFTGKVSYHSGTDIAAPYGTPILASAGGTVTIANGTDPWGGSYGYHIKISHNSTFDTLYAHCSTICVTQGQEVVQGQVIGYVGSTGNSTGNHLHFEVWMNGQRTDALSYFQS